MVSAPFEDWRHWGSLRLRLRLALGRSQSEPNSCSFQKVALAPDYSGPPARFGRTAHLRWSAARPFGIKLKIEIQEKLEWDWSQVHWRQLALSFVVEPGLNKIRGKDIALEQPIVICLQCVEHFT
jgi:hypothetical protein